ncbi:tetratricopeptide repeat protein [Candidatus Babeliales bacterium]|nr:tetratricopeptide repeat protein [Candidatus Babeliales bacterium]
MFDEVKRLEEVREELKKDPLNFTLLLEQGFLCMVDSEDIYGALESLEKALGIYPNDTDALFWLAMTYYYCFSRYEKALVVLEKAISIDSKRADCFQLLAKTIIALGYDSKAVLFNLKKPIELEPTWFWSRTILIRDCLEHEILDLANEQLHILKSRYKEDGPVEVKTLMDDYYEECFTGRNMHFKEEEIARLEDNIKDAKNKELK